MLSSQVSWLLGHNISLSELLNWTFQDWRMNHFKIREPKQAPEVWCRRSSPLNIRNNSSSIICAKALFEHILKRRKGHPATATVRNKPLTNSKETGTTLSLCQHTASGSCSREKQAWEEGTAWSDSSGWLAFFFFFFLTVATLALLWFKHPSSGANERRPQYQRARINK